MAPAFMDGLVSVIVPTHNRAVVLVEALSSVWKQGYRPIEIVVVDDGSTDGTGDIVEHWAERRCRGPALCVRYVGQPHRGASAARNAGLRLCRGQYVQFLDSDDLLLPRKLSEHVAALARDPAADIAYGPWLEEKRGRARVGQLPNLAANPSPSAVALHNLWTGAALYRRRVAVQAGPWDETLLCCQDWEYNVRAMLHVRKAVLVAEPLVLWRRACGDTISRASRRDPSYVEARVRANRLVRRTLLDASCLTDDMQAALDVGLLNCAADAITAGLPEHAYAILDDEFLRARSASLGARRVGLRALAGFRPPFGQWGLKALLGGMRTLRSLRRWRPV